MPLAKAIILFASFIQAKVLDHNIILCSLWRQGRAEEKLHVSHIFINGQVPFGLFNIEFLESFVYPSSLFIVVVVVIFVVVVTTSLRYCQRTLYGFLSNMSCQTESCLVPSGVSLTYYTKLFPQYLGSHEKLQRFRKPQYFIDILQMSTNDLSCPKL